MKNIFEFKNYQAYLLYFFQQRRGNQSRLAEYLECKSSYLTQVIDEKVHLTLDHALRVPDFLGMNKNEKIAFSFLVQKEKLSDAGSRKFIDEQIESLKNLNNQVRTRVQQAEELSEEAKSQYYSSWLYGAVHILCAFSRINTLEDIMGILKIDRATAFECIQFLLESNLITQRNNHYSIGKRQIHLDEQSQHIYNHHINWRLKVVEKLTSHQKGKLNFSSLIGISKSDAEKIRSILLDAISDVDKVVISSGEEKAYIINIDFMDL